MLSHWQRAHSEHNKATMMKINCRVSGLLHLYFEARCDKGPRFFVRRFKTSESLKETGGEDQRRKGRLLDQANNANSAITFVINLWSFRVVKSVTCRLTFESWAVFCLGRIRKKSIEEGECHDGRRDGDWVCNFGVRFSNYKNWWVQNVKCRVNPLTD